MRPLCSVSREGVPPRHRPASRPRRKESIPKKLREKHRPENLFVEDLPTFWRLLYTIVRDRGERYIVVIGIVDHRIDSRWFPWTRPLICQDARRMSLMRRLCLHPGSDPSGPVPGTVLIVIVRPRPVSGVLQRLDSQPP